MARRPTATGGARPPVAGAGRQLVAGQTDAIAAADLALVVLDADGRVLRFSDEATDILGYTDAEARGVPLEDLIIPESLRDAGKPSPLRYRAAGTGSLLGRTYEMPARHKDGTALRIALTVSHVQTDGRDLIVGALRTTAGEVTAPAEMGLSASFYRAIVERAPVIIALVTADGLRTWMSPTGRRVLGQAAGTTLGEALHQLVHPDDRAAALTALRDRTGLSEPVEVRLRGVDGSWHAVSWRAADLTDQPAVAGTVYYGTDITRARAAERREEVEAARLLALLNNLAVGVLVEDDQRRFLLGNPTLVEMFRLAADPADLAGAALAGPPPPGAAAAGWHALGNALDRAADEGGQEIPLPGGRVVELTRTPITVDGGQLGELWVAHDVSAAADARRSLQEHNDRLAALWALKTEFISIVSHELRTPLTSISSFTEMLGGPGELSSPDAPAAVAAIARNTDRMLVLVQDLKLLSQLETGDQAVATGNVDVADLGREVGTAIETGGRVITVRAEVESGPLLRGDEQLLRQLVHTVVGTVAACAAGEELTLRMAADDTCWVVQATAPSAEFITDEQLLAIPLPVLDDASRQRSAALSVLLARAIAQSHGGQLVADVQPAATATLTVRLPLRAAEEGTRAAGDGTQAAPKSLP
ncbi:MAG TPA: PAS domain-containing sensor histidine kinase [Pilimelia sp.]|nr:PAS domain-containing sensor histidine kinase [Pilimelia sp.]